MGIPGLEQLPIPGNPFGKGGMFGDAITIPVEMPSNVRDLPPGITAGVGAPQVGGLSDAQRAVLGLFGQQNPYGGSPTGGFTGVGGMMAPVPRAGVVFGGQVGAPLPTPAQVQAGQAPPLFGPSGPQIGGFRATTGGGPQQPPPMQPPPLRVMPQPFGQMNQPRFGAQGQPSAGLGAQLSGMRPQVDLGQIRHRIGPRPVARFATPQDYAGLGLSAPVRRMTAPQAPRFANQGRLMANIRGTRG